MKRNRDMLSSTENSFCLFFYLAFIFCFSSCSVDVDTTALVKQTNKDHYIIVFGDIQMYTYGYGIKYYDASINWINKKIEEGFDVCAVLEVGDVTQNNLETQWLAFRNSTVELAKRVPFFVCTGNHDYEWINAKIHERESSLINEYAHFPLSDKSIVSYFNNNSIANYIAQIRIGGELLNLLVMEFGPREEVLNWAIEYVQNHSRERFVLMTHEWLSAKGERMSTGTTAELQFKGYSSYSTPEDIWKKLVYKNDNIVCVLCGHEQNFSCHFLSDNYYGRAVPQLMFNLQFLPNGGNGIIQIWKLSENSNAFNVFGFDTINDSYYLPDSTSYTIPYNYSIMIEGYSHEN